MRDSHDLIVGAAHLGIFLSLDQIRQFEIYAELLSQENSNLNLTSASALQNIQRIHFLDSLALLPFIAAFPDSSPSLIDIGSGAGFPGIPLKICFPSLDVTLVEATRKKSLFLNQVVSKLELSSVSVIAERAEILAHKPDFREQFSICIARALGSLPTVLELTLPFVHIGGIVLSPRGVNAKAEAEAEGSTNSAITLGGSISSVNQLDERLLLGVRSVVVIDKQAESPSHLPRRVGMAKKKPLR